MKGPGIPAQVPVGGDEHVLEGVLRLLARAEHVPAEAEEPVVVAVVDRLERALVAPPQRGDEPLVGGATAQAQRGR